MRVAIFGEILEKQVVRDLEIALRNEGATVFATGPVWAGHLLPPLKNPPQEIDAAIAKTNEFAPDLIIVMRQSALRPSRIKQLRAPGRKIFVWLPDDPVLYRVYSQTIDEYDLALHCGGRKILKFYDKNGHKPGVRFPFWADEARLPYVGSRAEGPVSAAFFGLLTGRIKSGRADLLLQFSDCFPGGITVYGRGDIPEGLCSGGYLDGEESMRAALSRHHVMLNIPQEISAYVGTRWEQPEFKNMAHFEIPSRLVQMAALGLPVITLAHQQDRLRPILPHKHVPSPGKKLENYVEKLSKSGFRSRTGQRLREQFEKKFTSRLRARYVLQLYTEKDRNRSLSQRANGFFKP